MVNHRYWADVFNRYQSLERWGNSLIGKQYTGYGNVSSGDGIQAKTLRFRGEPVTVVSWDYVFYKDSIADYTLALDVQSTDGRIHDARYCMPLMARIHLRCYKCATEQNTLYTIGGLVKYPASYYADSMINRRGYGSKYTLEYRINGKVGRSFIVYRNNDNSIVSIHRIPYNTYIDTYTRID